METPGRRLPLVGDGFVEGFSAPFEDTLAEGFRLRASQHDLDLDVLGLGVGGVKPQVMGLGPVPATHRAMKHAGITADQIDRVEFNEAFAAQVIPSIKDLGIPEEKVNVNGGSIAIGHPLGATGARLCLTVAKELRRSNTRYGLATQCIGAGMGISTILERLD